MGALGQLTGQQLAERQHITLPAVLAALPPLGAWQDTQLHEGLRDQRQAGTDEDI